jgi:hypothetical protein
MKYWKPSSASKQSFRVENLKKSFGLESTNAISISVASTQVTQPPMLDL